MDLLRINQILATLALLYGIISLPYLIVRRSRFQKWDWIMNAELAVFLIVAGALDYLNLYGVKTAINSVSFFFFAFPALLATSIISFINKSKGSRRS